MTDADELRQLINGYQVTQAVHTIVELGIPDLLADGPQSAAALASAVGADERALYRVLRALATTDILDETRDSEFKLARLGELLRTDHQPSLAGWGAFIGRPALWNAWANLTHSVMTGETAFEYTHGTDVWTYRREHPEDGRAFDASMAAQTSTVESAIVEAYDFSRFAVVADIGGGNGTLLAAILRANPGLRGLLFDQEHVAARAVPVLEAAGVANRAETVSGDFFQAVPGGADAYLLKWIVHDWHDPEAIKILSNCRTAMGDDGRVLVVEREIEGPNAGAAAKWVDIQMLTMAGGEERTRQEFEDLFARSGLRLLTATPTRSGFVILEAGL